MTRVFRLSALLGLSLTLAACGGGGAPNPDPGAGGSGTDGPTSTVGGLVSLPGAIGGAQGGGAIKPEAIRQLDSWWTSPAAVKQRKNAFGAGGVIPGEFIVRRRPGLSAQAARTLSVNGATLRLQSALGLPGVGVYRLENAAGWRAQSASSVARALSARPDVVYAEPNRWMQVLRTPDDRLYPLQWDPPAMNLPRAWDVSTGKAVTVGVVDTGVVKHPDLVANLLPGFDFVDGDANPTDPGGDNEFHGSHVSGSIAAVTDNGAGIAGVSWGARVLPVRVLDGGGGGKLSDILAGALWASGYDFKNEGAPYNAVPLNKNPAKVINMSLGGSGACSQAEQDVFDYLAGQGVTVVVAAGNDNQDASNVSPANCRSVITVGAIGPDGARAPYSNYGPRIDVMAPGGNSQLKIRVGGQDIPGGIISTVGDGKGGFGYGILDGTSMAAPHVAGLAALLLGEQPDLTPAQLLARLKATSTPLPDDACGVSGGCGAGLVNAAAALSGTEGGTPAPTSPPTVGTIKTYVVALYQLSPGVYDEKRSNAVALSAKTLRAPYRLEDLVPGTYQVAAWQDLDGDQDINDGEPFGIYINPSTGKPGVTVDSVSRSIVGIDIDLQPYTPSGAASAARTGTPAKNLADALRRSNQGKARQE